MIEHKGLSDTKHLLSNLKLHRGSHSTKITCSIEKLLLSIDKALAGVPFPAVAFGVDEEVGAINMSFGKDKAKRAMRMGCLLVVTIK